MNAAAEVLLTWSPSVKGKDIDDHRGALKRLRRSGKHAWILVDALADRTRFQLCFRDHTFSQADPPEAIQEQLRQCSSPSQAFNRVYLLAQDNAEVPCYDITDYVPRCLAGDLSVADRLKGRTIFLLRQTEVQTEDLLTEDGVRAHAGRVLQPYIREFADYLGSTVIGFCCNLPTVLSPLRCEPLSIPWSEELIDRSSERIASAIVLTEKTIAPLIQSLDLSAQPISPEEFLRYLPLIFHETYDSAAVRSRFWEQLTQQFAEVCIGGLKKFCRESNLQLAINIPAKARALEVDVGELLNRAERPIFSVNEIEQPQRFLIAKWIASVPNPECSGQISIYGRDANASFRSDQLAYDSVLGFNSWIVPERVSTVPSKTLVNLNRFLSIGVPRRPILTVSPIHSLWTKPDGKEWNRLKKEWSWLCQTLWELGYDFDIASETELIAASVDSRSLRLKEAAYPLILLPTSLSLQEGTVNLLTQFVKARGKLIALAPVPYLLNGRIGVDPYPLERLLYRWRTSIVAGETSREKRDGLKNLLKKWIKPAVRVYRKPDNSQTNCIAIQHRQSKDFNLFYLFNREETAVEVLVEIQWEAALLEEWNTATGEQQRLDYWHADGKTYTTLSFERQQGRLIADRHNPIAQTANHRQE